MLPLKHLEIVLLMVILSVGYHTGSSTTVEVTTEESDEQSNEIEEVLGTSKVPKNGATNKKTEEKETSTDSSEIEDSTEVIDIETKNAIAEKQTEEPKIALKYTATVELSDEMENSTEDSDEMEIITKHGRMEKLIEISSTENVEIETKNAITENQSEDPKNALEYTATVEPSEEMGNLTEDSGEVGISARKGRVEKLIERSSTENVEIETKNAITKKQNEESKISLGYTATFEPSEEMEKSTEDPDEVEISTKNGRVEKLIERSSTKNFEIESKNAITEIQSEESKFALEYTKTVEPSEEMGNLTEDSDEVGISARKGRVKKLIERSSTENVEIETKNSITEKQNEESKFALEYTVTVEPSEEMGNSTEVSDEVNVSTKSGRVEKLIERSSAENSVFENATEEYENTTLMTDQKEEEISTEKLEIVKEIEEKAQAIIAEEDGLQEENEFTTEGSSEEESTEKFKEKRVKSTTEIYKNADTVQTKKPVINKMSNMKDNPKKQQKTKSTTIKKNDKIKVSITTTNSTTEGIINTTDKVTGSTKKNGITQRQKGLLNAIFRSKTNNENDLSSNEDGSIKDIEEKRKSQNLFDIFSNIFNPAKWFQLIG